MVAGERLSLHPATVRQAADLETRAAIARAAGFSAWGLRGVEIEHSLHAGHTLESLAAMMHRHALRASDAGALNDWQWTGRPPLVNRVVPPEGDGEDRLWMAVERFFARCTALGVPTVVAVGAGQEAGTIDDAAAGLREIGRRAAVHGLTVAYEVLGTARILNSYAAGMDVVRKADAPNVGLLLDLFHFYRGGGAVALLKEIPAERVLLVRLSDAPPGPRESLTGAVRLMPGQGVIPLREIVAVLESRGFSGYYSVEVVHPESAGRPAGDVAREAYDHAARVLRD